MQPVHPISSINRFFTMNRIKPVLNTLYSKYKITLKMSFKNSLRKQVLFFLKNTGYGSFLCCCMLLIPGLSAFAKGRVKPTWRIDTGLVKIKIPASGNINSLPYPYHSISALSIDQPGLKWVDSLISTLSLEEKIGQLFMVPAFSRYDSYYRNEIRTQILDYHIGGILFMRGGPVRQVQLVNYLQSVSRIPLLISIDAECGLGMRLDSTMTFPHEMALGAIRDNKLIYNMAYEIARQCRAIGVHMDMAPVVDVNDNPYNPIINERSFGENKTIVAAKGIAYMQGLQDGGILAVAKHFPGHGDSFEDSHLTLPVIDRNARQMDSVELYPFKKLINQGLSGIMTAHLSVPSLDPTINLASSLSKPIVTDLLKIKLGFSGLAITDAMNMSGVSHYYPAGDRDVKALMAGNDIILLAENIPVAFRSILHAVGTGQLSRNEIDAKVRKILMAKYLTGLKVKRAPIQVSGITLRLNMQKAKYLNQQLVEASLTVLGNADKTLPIRDLLQYKFAEVSIGELNGNTFQKTLGRYARVPAFSTYKDGTDSDYAKLEDSLKSFNTVIIALHNLEKSDKDNYGVRGSTREFIARLQAHKKIILVVFGNPYLLSNFAGLQNVVVAYDDSPTAQSLTAQLIFGAIGANGRLPVTASPQFKAGDGEVINPIGRIKYTMPDELGISPASLLKIDSIAIDGIVKKAYPGCTIMAIKDGKVFYAKAFGTHTYLDRTLTQLDDVFDLASVTKISSTVLATMKLYDQGLLDLHKPISTYLPELINTNKQNIQLIDLLTHQAGLVPYIPFYLAAMKEPGVFSPDSSAAYPVRVAQHMYQRADYFKQVIWKQVISSPTKTPGKYVYSDLSMYFMRAVVEKVSNDKLDNFAMKTFYEPLGLTTMGFNPRNRIAVNRFMPTENDKLWRKQLLVGDVHDQGAAMQGGVAGHAGLFSDVIDLATLGQMLLQHGIYAERSYIKESTVDMFNTRPYPLTSRRGIGFDKPEKDPQQYPGSKYASQETFGHTGFTGTCIWVDPDVNLVYVFLSNRICPDGENAELSALRIRAKIQNAFYEAILKH